MNSPERAAYEHSPRKATKATPGKKNKRSPQPSKRAPIPAPSKRAPAPSKRAPAPSKRAPQPSKRAPQPSKRAPAPSKRTMPYFEDQGHDDEAKFENENRGFNDDNDTHHQEPVTYKRDVMRVLTEDRCRPGYSLCGGWRKGADEWECLDTSNSLDSCAQLFTSATVVLTSLSVLGGGCAFPYYLDENPKIGIDCSSLPGVVGVECRDSSCFVHNCADGYSLSPAMNECIRIH